MIQTVEMGMVRLLETVSGAWCKGVTSACGRAIQIKATEAIAPFSCLHQFVDYGTERRRGVLVHFR